MPPRVRNVIAIAALTALAPAARAEFVPAGFGARRAPAPTIAAQFAAGAPGWSRTFRDAVEGIHLALGAAPMTAPDDRIADAMIRPSDMPAERLAGQAVLHAGTAPVAANNAPHAEEVTGTRPAAFRDAAHARRADFAVPVNPFLPIAASGPIVTPLPSPGSLALIGLAGVLISRGRRRPAGHTSAHASPAPHTPRVRRAFLSRPTLRVFKRSAASNA